MEITYHKEGNYLIPDLKLPEKKHFNHKIGKYGYLRLDYLKKFRKAFYNRLLITNNLEEHLITIDIAANELEKEIINRLSETEHIDNNDQLSWVQTMNNIRNKAQEVVLKEIVYIEEA